MRRPLAAGVATDASAAVSVVAAGIGNGVAFVCGVGVATLGDAGGTTAMGCGDAVVGGVFASASALAGTDTAAGVAAGIGAGAACRIGPVEAVAACVGAPAGLADAFCTAVATVAWLIVAPVLAVPVLAVSVLEVSVLAVSVLAVTWVESGGTVVVTPAVGAVGAGTAGAMAGERMVGLAGSAD
jgi:hypothetical protein